MPAHRRYFTLAVKEVQGLTVDYLALRILATDNSIYTLYPIKIVANDSRRESKEAAGEGRTSFLPLSDQQKVQASGEMRDIKRRHGSTGAGLDSKALECQVGQIRLR